MSVAQELARLQTNVDALIEKAKQGGSIVDLLDHSNLINGYPSVSYGGQARIVTNATPHFTFDYTFLEIGKVYTFKVPASCTWEMRFFDEQKLYRNSTGLNSATSHTFVATMPYVLITIKFVPKDYELEYANQIKLYEDKNVKATEIDLTDIFNDEANWEHYNLAYGAGKSFETNKGGTNSSYMRYNLLIPIAKRLPILVQNCSQYSRFNVQEYDTEQIARYNGGTNVASAYFENYYPNIALVPNVGSSTAMSDVLSAYKQYLRLFQLEDKEVTV